MRHARSGFLSSEVLRSGPVAVELMLVAILGVLLAEAVWFTIHGTDIHRLDIRLEAAGGPASEAPRFESADLAGLFADRRSADESDLAPETQLNFRLRGVRAGESSGAGTAIIDVPGRGQILVRPGEEISSGVVLEEVESAYVVIRRSGIRESLFLTDAAALRARAGRSGAALTAEQSVSQDAPALSLEDWRDGLRVEPVVSDGAMRGLRVGADSRADVLRASSLQPGDLIVSANGRALNSPEAALALIDSLETADRAVLTIEREGATQTLEIAPNPGG